MSLGVIFDLDDTLVDSSVARAVLKRKDWVVAEKMIPYFKLYEGIERLLSFLSHNNIEYAIATSSPRKYCEAVLQRFSIRCAYLVCSDDVKECKPQPDQIAEAAAMLKLSPYQIFALGDRAKDIEAYQSAGVISVACAWGSHEIENLLKQKPVYVAYHPAEVISLLTAIVGKKAAGRHVAFQQ